MASVNSERSSLLINEWGNSYTPNVLSPLSGASQLSSGSRRTPQMGRSARGTPPQPFLYIQERLEPEESDKPATEERIPITKRTWFICLKVVTLCVLSICGVFSITFVP